MSQVRSSDFYVSHKVNKLRWLGDSNCFVTGSWDEPLYTQKKWGKGNVAQQNKLCFWKMNYTGSSTLDLPNNTGTIAHEGDVTEMTYIQSSLNSVVTSSSTGEVSLFEQNENGKIRQHKIGNSHRGPATAVDVVKGNADSVVSAGEDGRVNLYSINRQSLLQTWESGQSITSMRLQNDTTKLFTGSTSGHLRFWDTSASKKPQINVRGEESGAIHSLDIHPTRPLLVATGSEDGSLCIWDLRNYSQHLCRYKQHQASVWEIKFHATVPDYLLSSGDEGDLFLWDFHSPTSIQTQYEGKDRLAVHRLLHSSLSLNSFDVHPSNNVLVAGSDNEVLHSINLNAL